MTTESQKARSLRVIGFQAATAEELAADVQEWLSGAGEKVLPWPPVPVTAGSAGYESLDAGEYAVLIFYAE